MQEAILFSGSIAGNIRQGRPAASDNELDKAAQAAQASEFIATLPDGYASELGQRGVNLSGGQKQRVAIARALIRQPDILILDGKTPAPSWPRPCAATLPPTCSCCSKAQA